MRIITIIMAVYILLLSVVPCSDAHNECSKSKSSSEVTSKHNHDKDQDDVCSPFCTCACCGISVTFNVIYSPIPIQSSFFFEKPQKEAIREFNLISCFSGKIWQPPKFNC